MLLISLGRREKSSPCAASRGAAGRVGAHSSSPPGDAAGSTHAVPRVHLCVLHPSLKKKIKINPFLASFGWSGQEGAPALLHGLAVEVVPPRASRGAQHKQLCSSPAVLVRGRHSLV